MEFDTEEKHREWVKSQSALPSGFSAGTCGFDFKSVELGKAASMDISTIILDAPTSSYCAMFTSNRFPGAPITVGKEVAANGKIKAVMLNNKISNVCAENGINDCRAVCEALGKLIDAPADQILPASTGIIGWRIPVADMVENLPAMVSSLQSDSIYPVSKAIMTTDLYPKVRSVEIDGVTITGIAKGAGMIEPNLATMLVFILTDAIIEKQTLDKMFRSAVDTSFNSISIDSDQSTSDIALCLSSGKKSVSNEDQFAAGLTEVCENLARDLVRNGEGVKHVIEVEVTNAPTAEIAKSVGKTVVNSPLVQTAVCGNDPNIGRLLMAIGNCAALDDAKIELSNSAIKIGGYDVFKDGVCVVNESVENSLADYFKDAEMYQSKVDPETGSYYPQVSWPVHQKSVQIEVDLKCGDARARVWGGDRTHEYITENADYRS